MNRPGNFITKRARVLRDQRGITGLETAIVLIAFVVVASVFAFAVLSTGLLSTEQSKEAVLGGLAETQSALLLQGTVIAHEGAFEATYRADLDASPGIGTAALTGTFDETSDVDLDLNDNGNVTDLGVTGPFVEATLGFDLNDNGTTDDTIAGPLDETGAGPYHVDLNRDGDTNDTAVLPSIARVTFQVRSASQGGEPVDLSSDLVVVTYIDSNQAANLAFTETPLADIGWGSAFIAGSGPLLNDGERVEFTVNLGGLTEPLVASTEFTIQVKPSVGAGLQVTRTTPAELKPVVNLQ